MSLHRARNVVVHLYYSFELCSLAVAWQSEKVRIANFLNLFSNIFCFFLVHPLGKQLAICTRLCNLLLASFFCWFALPSIGDALCF